MTDLPARTSGNAFIYILISVLLLGALTFAISRSNDNNPSNEISDAAAKAAATAILGYEGQARSAIDQMIQNGADVSNIDFSLPSSATFNTPPTINKLFHPDGGGLDYKTLPANAADTSATAPAAGYYLGVFNNFEWTPSTTQDVIFAAWNIKKSICAAVNYKITGSTTIPSLTSARTYIVSSTYSGAANGNLTAALCPACDGKPSLCVFDAVSSYAYYSILVGR